MKRIPRPEYQPRRNTDACVVVGNGPSLAPGLLDTLKLDSLAMNRIHLIYDKTEWRPTYWFNCDLSSNYLFKEDLELHALQGYPCLVRIDIISRWVAGYLGVLYPEELVGRLRNIWPINAGAYDWTDEIVAPGATVASAIRAAALWGYNPIYLIGCDGGFIHGEVNHFDPSYTDGFTEGRPAEKFNQTLDEVFAISFAECEKRGIKIYNATPGSKIKGIPLCEPL